MKQNNNVYCDRCRGLIRGGTIVFPTFINIEPIKKNKEEFEESDAYLMRYEYGKNNITLEVYSEICPKCLSEMFEKIINQLKELKRLGGKK